MRTVRHPHLRVPKLLSSVGLLRLLALITAGFAPLIHAQTSLLPAGGMVSLALQRPDAASATRSVVPVAGQSFPQAVRVATAKLPSNPWNIQLSVPTAASVAAGDVLAGEIWLRRMAPSSGPALAELVFEKAGPPYDQSLVRVLPEEAGVWTRYRFAFTSKAAYASAGAQFNIRLGYALQTLEMGGLTLTNHGKAKPLANFSNDLTYAGREPDAAWRSEANAAIERNRKATFSIELKDADGFAMAGVPVELRLVRHDFAFGSAVAASRLLAVGADSDRYRGVITQWFNTVVLENDLKWPTYEANPAPAQNAVTWLGQRGIPVRGHNLIWPGTNQNYFLPANVPPLFTDVPRLHTRINTHFTNVLDRFRGKLPEWDVVNEPLHERALEGIMGKAEVASWFQLARNLDPAAILYLNEYANIESVTRTGSTDLRTYSDQLRTLGTPIDALGLQAHFSGFLTSPTELLARLDLISGIGPGTNTYPLRITEFDINISDEAVQADYTRDFLTAAFSHPAVTGVLMWGFWESQHWLPQAALFRRNWQPKPNALAWSNLVYQTWTTRTNVMSSSSGKATARGFKGDYEVTIRLPETNLVSTVRFGSDTDFRPALPVVRPTLAVIPGDRFEFQWAGFASGYQLEWSDRLDATTWNPVDGFATYSTNGWRVQLPAPDQTQFYRLRRGGP